MVVSLAVRVLARSADALHDLVVEVVLLFAGKAPQLLAVVSVVVGAVAVAVVCGARICLIFPNILLTCGSKNWYSMYQLQLTLSYVIVLPHVF